jgi:hypothetical protein
MTNDCFNNYPIVHFLLDLWRYVTLVVKNVIRWLAYKKKSRP